MGIIVVSWWARQPSVATNNGSTTQVKAATTDDIATYTNDYIRMQIPKRFVAKQPTIGTGKPIYFQQLLTAPIQNSGGVFSDQLAVVVGALPLGGLPQVSDIQLRARSSEYVPIQTDSANVVAYESIHSSTYEVGYFTSNGQMYTSIVASTSLANKNQAKELVKNAVLSLEWHD